jgi:AcrR family transcriptional regulator
MSVSGQAQPLPAVERGPRVRMRRLMLETAIRLMQSGGTPSVTDVAEAAEVSRATAYRYFPSQAAMLQAVVDEALGPILSWSSELESAEERVGNLIAHAYPRILDYEATHRAALLLALDQWSRRQAGTFGDEARIVRGNRRALLKQALDPLRGRLSRQAFDKVAQSLSLIFGIEAIVVLRDIWNLDGDEAERVAAWAALALVRAAVSEAGRVNGPGPRASRNAAARPRGKGPKRSAH